MCTLLYQQMSDMPTGCISNRPNFVRIVNSLVAWTLSTGLVMWCVFFLSSLCFRLFFGYCILILVNVRVSAIAWVLSVSYAHLFYLFRGVLDVDLSISYSRTRTSRWLFISFGGIVSPFPPIQPKFMNINNALLSIRQRRSCTVRLLQTSVV
jgi:hypothetical protein